MTKEENIATLNEHLDHWKRLLSEKICDQDEGEKTIDALQNAIKALAQEPTDAVDRVTIKEYLSSFEVPQQKMGHWILTDDDFVYCSECEDSYYPRPIDASWYYCPHCGAKMQEVWNDN